MQNRIAQLKKQTNVNVSANSAALHQAATASKNKEIYYVIGAIILLLLIFK